MASLGHPHSTRVEIEIEPIRSTGDALFVNSRALTLAIGLLCSTAISAAAVSLSGCGCGIGYDPWMPTDTVQLGADVDLLALSQLPNTDQFLAVGTGGTIIVWGVDHEDGTDDRLIDRVQVGEETLRGVWADETAWWVVGDAGTAAVSDRGLTWTPVDLGTNADLYAITSVGSRLVVVGDDVVLLQGVDGTWAEVPAPEGGWGSLRAVHHDGTRVYAVGLSGKVWSAADPSGEWVAENVGTNVDLFDVGTFSPNYGGSIFVAVVGANGTLLLRDDDGWKSINTQVDVDLVAYEDAGVLTANGDLYELNDKRRLKRIDTLSGARALSYRLYDGAVAVGVEGVAYRKPYFVCPGGRPFVVDGEAITATLQIPEGSSAVARAWADDAAYEHASVASFARFALELLALGAPPALLREVQVAIADELRHAELCFGLARRFGMPVEPGAMQMPTSVLARAGDPVATAIALFEEGCINESLAACEAADAAGSCEDAEVREVLERIGADERRHAALAWGALRWLIDTHGERVRAPLRAKLARLRLPAQTKHVHRRVFAELIIPLAHAMFVHERAHPREFA